MVGSIVQKVIQSGAASAEQVQKLVEDIKADPSADTQALRQVEDLLVRLDGGDSVKVADSSDRRRMINALRSVSIAPKPGQAESVVGELTPEKITPEFVRTLSVAQKADILKSILVDQTFVTNDSEQVVINVLDGMNSQQLSIAIMELHRKHDAVGEFREDIDGTGGMLGNEFSEVRERFRERLTELSPQASALVLSKFFTNGGEADKEIRNLYQLGEAGKSAALEILGSYVELGLKFPTASKSGPTIITTNASGTTAIGPGGSYHSGPGGSTLIMK